MVDDWAKNAAREFLAREQKRLLQSEKDLSDRKLKQEALAHKWSKLQELFSHKTLDFNKQVQRDVLKWELVSDRSFAVGQKGKQSSLNVSLDPGMCRLIISINRNTVSEYTLQIKAGDECDFRSGDGPFVSLEQIAEDALTHFLNWES